MGVIGGDGSLTWVLTLVVGTCPEDRVQRTLARPSSFPNVAGRWTVSTERKRERALSVSHLGYVLLEVCVEHKSSFM